MDPTALFAFLSKSSEGKEITDLNDTMSFDFSDEHFERMRRALDARQKIAQEKVAARQRLFYKNHRQEILDARKEQPRKQRKTLRHLAVLDFETDPFDNTSSEYIHPFMACIYSDQFPFQIFWAPRKSEGDSEQWDWQALCQALVSFIEALPGKFIIYAHNGGRFDFMFLLHLLRGQVSFKGRSMMSARIGNHELRDSFHILPDKLDNLTNKGKMVVDYTEWMTKKNRNKYMVEINEYCLDDCRKLFDTIKAFVDEFGTPLTIGQAAMSALKKEYHYENLSERWDRRLRLYFAGGRVECRQSGIRHGNFALYDVNSMYPYCMSAFRHPVSNEITVGNQITEHTIFITLECQSNGALFARDEDGGIGFNCGIGEKFVSNGRPTYAFHTTIWEYNIAVKHGLLSDLNILRTYDFDQRTDFSRFINPLYARRYEHKQQYEVAKQERRREDEIYHFRQMTFLKFLMNNAYGKFAQDPRRFKEYILTTPSYDHAPSLEVDKEFIERFVESFPSEERDRMRKAFSWGDEPEEAHEQYFVWSRLNPSWRFNNVATAASITGAARSILLDAICNATDVLYCDTDSIICASLSNVVQDKFALGAWDCEAELDVFIGNGKKLYGYHRTDVPSGSEKEYVIRTKGSERLSWQEMLELASGKEIKKTMKGPTLYRSGEQQYLTRTLRKTA